MQKKSHLRSLGAICLGTALLFGSTQITAQSWREKDVDYFPRHEITIHYGTPTILELTTQLGSPKMSGNAQGKSENHQFTGAAGLGYQFSINPNLAIGIAGGISHAGADIVLTADTPQLKAGTKLYNSALTTYSVQLNAHWTYLEEDLWSLSCGVYAGAAYMDEHIQKYLNSPALDATVKYPSDRMKLAYHLTALKVRYGDVFGVYGELGFGYRGLVNIGISIKL